MKALTIPLLFISFMSVAQPGDPSFLRRLDPCGIPPNDTIDVTSDGIPDLVIGGWSVGTDDEPSSTGSCALYVGTLPGTTLLCSTKRNEQRVAHGFAAGDTVPGVDSKVQNDLQIPRFVYTEWQITVWQWGYGGGWMAPTATPDLEEQVFVFLTVSPTGSHRGTFTLHPIADLRSVRVVVGALADTDVPLIIR